MYYLLLGGVLTPREIGDGMHRPARDTTEENISKRDRINDRQILQYSEDISLIHSGLH